VYFRYPIASNNTLLSKEMVFGAFWTRFGLDFNHANIGKQLDGSHVTRKSLGGDCWRLTKQLEVSSSWPGGGYCQPNICSLLWSFRLSLSVMSEPATGTTPVPTLETNGTTNESSRRPPPRLSCSCVDHNNIGTLRKLNSVIFPIVYTERFYAETLVAEHADYCKLGL